MPKKLLTDREINKALRIEAKRLRSGYFVDLSDVEDQEWYREDDFGMRVGPFGWLKKRFEKTKSRMGFTMNFFSGKVKGCGTACCIGGGMAYALGARGDAEVSRIVMNAQYGNNRPYIEGAIRPRLYELFNIFPNTRVTPKRAAKAIDRYLAGKKPWPSCEDYNSPTPSW